MPSETNKEVAERITETAFAEGYSLVSWRKAIEAALNAERERCAKIAETNADERCRENARQDIGICGKQIAFQIRHAAAIRGSKD